MKVISKPPKLQISDSVLYGLTSRPATAATDFPLIDVNLCALDIRNSPALGGFYTSYLKLPNYVSDSAPLDPAHNYGSLKTPRRVSVNIDSHSLQHAPVLQDPSGVVTGRINGTVDRQRSQATVVDATIGPETSGEAKIDLAPGGTKTISLLAEKTFLSFHTGSMQPVAGQILHLVLINRRLKKSPAQLYLPFHFFPVSSSSSYLEVSHGQVKGFKYIFQQRISALKVRAVTPPPYIMPQVGDPVSGSGGGSGKLLQIAEGTLFVALRNETSRFKKGENFSLGGESYKVEAASGCWMPFVEV
jgi:hypothetical protein